MASEQAVPSSFKRRTPNAKRRTPNAKRSSNRFETERRVVATEAEGVVQSNSYVLLAGDIRDVVQVALRVRIIEIDSGRHHAMIHGQDANCTFHCSRAAEQMTNHRFGRADQKAILSVIAGEPFN